jgi:hypothetical protein
MSVAQRWVVGTELRRSWTAILGTLVVASGGAMIGLLCTTGAGVNPLSQPLSLYALTPAAWLFDTGVVIVALGLGILLLALVRTGTLAGRSVGSAAILMCATGLIVLTIFPDHDPHGDLSPVGWIHWAASMVAFATLPIVPILLGHRHRRAAGCSPLPGIARVLGIVASSLLLLFVAGSALQFTLSIPADRIGGAVERMLVAAELAAALIVGLWTWRGCPSGRAACRRAHPRVLHPVRCVDSGIGVRRPAGRDPRTRPIRTASARSALAARTRQYSSADQTAT